MAEEKNTSAAKGSNRPSLLLFGGVITFVIIALALGLGLGLGLKHHTHGQAAATDSTTPAPSPGPTASGASENVQSWRRSTLEYDLNMNWNINASPTVRPFNFTLSEIQAAPDGKILSLEYLFLR